MWLDDIKPAPPGWVWVRSSNETIALLQAGPVEFLSLDHDLGIYVEDGGDGVAVTDWLAEHGHWPTGGVRIHSQNSVGVPTMLTTIDMYSPYPLGYSSHRGESPPTGWPVARVEPAPPGQ